MNLAIPGSSASILASMLMHLWIARKPVVGIVFSRQLAVAAIALQGVECLHIPIGFALLLNGVGEVNEPLSKAHSIWPADWRLLLEIQRLHAEAHVAPKVHHDPHIAFVAHKRAIVSPEALLDMVKSFDISIMYTGRCCTHKASTCKISVPRSDSSSRHPSARIGLC